MVRLRKKPERPAAQSAGGDRKGFYAAYTLAMFCVFSVLFFIFWRHKKSFVWSSDGLLQHYTSLAYWGKYLREIIRGVLFRRELKIPMWDLHIGYGADILTTLHYYVIGDPLNLLSVFAPERYTEYLFDFLICLRIYLAGAAFSAYCFYHKHDKIPVLLGSVMYAWSQWIIVAGPNHPYFINPCIYLPLILLGIDKIYDGKKQYHYIFAIALAGVSNFYFFYMLGIFAVIYAVFRYFMKFKGVRLKELGGWLSKFFAYSLAGISLSGAVLVPVLMSVMSTGRMETERYTPILYSPKFYRTLLAAFAGKNVARYSYIGMASVCVLSLVILFLQKKKYRSLKLGVLLLTVMVCTPVLGRALNGFSYVSNRWSWAFSMLTAYIFVKMYPEFFRLTKIQRAAAGIAGVLYAGFLIFDPVVKGRHNRTAGMLLLAFILAAVLGYRHWCRNRRIWAVLLAVSIFAGVGSNIWFFYEGENGEDGRVFGHIDAGTCYDRNHSKTNQAISRLDGIMETRYEQNSVNMESNSAMVNGVNSGRFYFSIAPDGEGEFFEDMHMQNHMEQSIINLNSRAWMLKLFSTGYYVGKEKYAPYGFKPVENVPGLSRKYVAARDEEALPFAYTYDKCVSMETYEKMNTVQRQEALLEGAVVEENSLPEAEIDFQSEEIPFTVEESHGIVQKGNGCFKVEKGGGNCVLSFKGSADCENYVTFTGLFYEGINKGRKTLTEPKDITTAFISVNIPDKESKSGQRFRFLSYKNNFQCGRSNFGVNLGYREEPLNKIQVVFHTEGDYEIEDLKVLCQKMEKLPKLSRARRENAPKDLTIGCNRIHCTVDFNKKRELVFSIPYSKGWTLYVDGKKQNAQRVNRMFIGTELTEGNHDVELTYRTPYLFAGIFLSLLGFAMVAAMAAYDIRHRLSARCSGRC